MANTKIRLIIFFAAKDGEALYSQQKKDRNDPGNHGTSPDGQHQNQIDYILCSQTWRSSIQSAKARPGADCGSDHELLISKFRLKLKKVEKITGPFSSVQFSHSVVSNSLQPHELQLARPPCPSPTPGVHSAGMT